MPNTYKGRGYSGTRSATNRMGFSSFFSNNWNRPTPTTKKSSSRTRKSSAATGGTKYRQVCNTFACKIDSFKTLYSQAQGPNTPHRPTPAVLNSFANWINKGAVIQTCTPQQVARWARSTNKNFNPRTPSTAACKNVLGAKFGKSTIKAVARTKNGHFMVATSPTSKGRPFCFPS